jgi:hypothetical protein
MIYKFIGTIPAESNSGVVEDSKNSVFPSTGRVPEQMGQHIELNYPDSDPRAGRTLPVRHQTPGAVADGTTGGESWKRTRGHEL